ncbi:aconitate hydratase AcnA [Saccharospirillum alexandrii]|uniref:aconitate hydratase AcnA n=1 Tax=Saccharospirillum alexandrii TaxID=2448477 RepID=UPI000FD6C6D3|nr:aconitate hydratase AcnA [Saccharospirillum alexandrii]
MITDATGSLNTGNQVFNYVDLKQCFGDKLTQLPIVLRLLLENVLRTATGLEREEAAKAIETWLSGGSSSAEIPYRPGRILMHDTTSTPALVDIAAMRDAVAEAGGDPSALRPMLPVDVSIDHSVAVEAYASRTAVQENLQHEIRRNNERYRFLKWASQALEGVRIHPPGTGIMHTINLEQLATVVTYDAREDSVWLAPDMMIGTDSHTPMINGIGVLGWGVGGLEAEMVMFGIPLMLRLPEVVGVRLVGKLQAGTQATDLALVVTKRLRELDVTGQFVEFFGPGVSALTAGDRSVIANMAPEYGATTGYFGVDLQTIDYLRSTGRSEELISLVESYFKATDLWFDPLAFPTYTKTIEIDLDQVGIHVAGPTRPQDLHDYGDVAHVLSKLNFQPLPGSRLPRHPVAIAAITSCTNTSDPKLLITAGLLARNLRLAGLKPPAWVKTSLAPGSPAAANYLKKAGLMDDLSAIGFDIVGYGCTTCIGNPGPLTEIIRKDQIDGHCRPVAILSGNRNFPGRVHPDLDLGFIMSPAMVLAFAVAGDAEINLRQNPVGFDREGNPMMLRDLWPASEEVETIVSSIESTIYQKDFLIASQNSDWQALESSEQALFPWNSESTTLRRPPFATSTEGSQLGTYSAYPLLLLGDDVTTDHISPASAIPKDSNVADFLVERGDSRDDLNVFASRRGNWEVMMRATFHNKAVRNGLTPDGPVAHTLHIPTGEVVQLVEAARRYREHDDSVVVVAGERYGMGSSRDWAAKGQRLLGIRAVLAISFERIHRTNLIGMGILPLQIPQNYRSAMLSLNAGSVIHIDVQPDALSPRAAVPIKVEQSDGSSLEFNCEAQVDTQAEVALLRAGGAIPFILARNQAH